MQKIKKTYRVDPEKNASPTDRWMDRLMGRGTGLILYDPFSKDGGLIMFYGNSRINFS